MSEDKTNNVLHSFWFNSTISNYNLGDSCNETVLAVLFNRKPVISDGKDNERLIGSGSLIGEFEFNGKKDIFWGTGSVEKNSHQISKNSIACAVRGPLTEKKLRSMGITVKPYYFDTGIFAPFAYGIPYKILNKKYEIGVIPHFSDYTRNLSMFEDMEKKYKGVKLINITEHPYKVMTEIAQCNMVLSDSLHGLIIAECMKIPVVYIRNESILGGSEYKFTDYFLGSGRTLKDIISYTWNDVFFRVNNGDIKYMKKPNLNVCLNSAFCSSPYCISDGIVNKVFEYYN